MVKPISSLFFGSLMYFLYALALSLTLYGVKGSPVASLEETGQDEIQNKLTEVGRKSLEEAMKGIDLEKHRSRLIKLSKNVKQLTDEEKEKIDKLKKEISLIAMEKHENDTDSIIDINNREGLTDYLFEGDIILSEEQLASLERESVGGSVREKRQAIIGGQWTDATVYYYFDYSLNNEKRSIFVAATRFIESHTCIRFIQSQRSPTRSIKVFNGNGCFAAAGMQYYPDRQTLSLGKGCESLGTAIHEIMHSLGIFHEQSRYDRDDYISINLRDVPEKNHHNFNKYKNTETTNYTPYEYGSVMHYRVDSFVRSRGSMSLVPRDKSYLYTMGGNMPSFYDIYKINKYYGCDARCSRGNVPRCQNGGVPNPRSCSTCECPSGYGGALCNERPPGCGETLQASTQWQTKNVAFSRNVAYPGSEFKLCNYWITAPAGRKIEVAMAYIDEWGCFYGCPFTGIEIKTKADPKIVNPRICCKNYERVVFTSELNPTPIISFYTKYDRPMTFAYRYR